MIIEFSTAKCTVLVLLNWKIYRPCHLLQCNIEYTYRYLSQAIYFVHAVSRLWSPHCVVSCQFVSISTPILIMESSWCCGATKATPVLSLWLIEPKKPGGTCGRPCSSFEIGDVNDNSATDGKACRIASRPKRKIRSLCSDGNTPPGCKWSVVCIDFLITCWNDNALKFVVNDGKRPWSTDVPPNHSPLRAQICSWSSQRPRAGECL